MRILSGKLYKGSTAHQPYSDLDVYTLFQQSFWKLQVSARSNRRYSEGKVSSTCQTWRRILRDVHQKQGLILSSFQVLQDSRPPHPDVRQHLKLNCSFLGDPQVMGSDQDESANQVDAPEHVCDPDTAEGDEMFDVTDSDQFRGDDVGDSLDNTTNNSLDREDEGDDEEEEEDEDDDDGAVMSGDGLQGIANQKADVTAETGIKKRVRTPSVSDLRAHHHHPDSFEELTPALGAHGYLDSTGAVWHPDGSASAGGNRYPADWHMALTSGNGVSAREVIENGVLSGSLSPGGSTETLSSDQHWKFVHGHGPASAQHVQHWGNDDGAPKVVVGGPVGQSWVTPKQEMMDSHQHDLQAMHHHSDGHWSQHIRPGQTTVHGWHKDLGAVITPDEDMAAVRNLFNLQAAPSGMSAPTVSSSFSDLACANPGTWNINSHLPAMGALPRPLIHHDITCHRPAPPAYFHQGQAQGYAGFQGQGHEGWQHAAMNPGSSGLPVDGSSEHFNVADVQSSIVCKSAILSKRAKGRSSKCSHNISSSDIATKSRPTLDQVRQQTHPYQMKEQKKVVRDVYPATSANVHTLKASHIVSWYIDYLIHENEHLTQISRAFSLPVNLFLSDDFYFMDSLKKKVHFPSLKFLSWMQQNLPSINVNAIDFHEGRPPVVSTWNQEWFWQNKSRRDIIHDVFFYFQHRRVTCEN